jgi:hypothetical protein
VAVQLKVLADRLVGERLVRLGQVDVVRLGILLGLVLGQADLVRVTGRARQSEVQRGESKAFGRDMVGRQSLFRSVRSLVGPRVAPIQPLATSFGLLALTLTT